MKKLLTYLLSYLIALSFETCKRDNPPCGGGKDYHYLSEGEKTKVPYTGIDTLVFISNTNDTAVCIGQGKEQFYKTLTTPVANGDCNPRIDYYEAYNYKFKSNNLKFNLDFNAYKNDLYGDATIHILFNQSDFPIYIDEIDNSKTPYYMDSLKIVNEWYKRITFTSKYFDSTLDKLYYNKEFGILKIQNSDSTEVWELLTKK